jgi:hypothetical protein
MRTLSFPLAAATCLVLAGALWLSALAADGDVTVVEDLVFATDREDPGAMSMLDLYLGAEGEDVPMVVFVDGQGLSRKSRTALPMALAARGVNVAVLDGPIAEPEAALAGGGGGLRELVETVACAVRFARGSGYGSETAPLVLSGYSYGGGSSSHVAIAGDDFASLWDGFDDLATAPSRIECTSEGSTRVDGFVGIVGTYDIFVGQEGRFSDALWQQEAPELRKVFQNAVGLHPELKVRLLAGDSDWLPFEVPAGLEAVLAPAGYDVELIEFEGGHVIPFDVTVEQIMELVMLAQDTQEAT